jgi:hypothetical protein
VHRHLSYANVMATVAVFIALGGGAYAATALPKNSVGATQLRNDAVSSAKIKQGSLQRSDFRTADLVKLRGPAGTAGSPGEAGAAGPAGATGAKGEPGARGEAGATVAKGDKGDKGDAGTTGAKGDKGDAGHSALTTLQSGDTVRGVFGVDGTASDAGQQFATGVTLPVPAPTAFGNLDVSVAGGFDDNSACTGSYAAPTAPAGNVCIYPESAGLNVDQASGLVPGDHETPYGFIVQAVSAADGPVVFQGSWAYTAE